jgi:4-hydroxy-tetrahydrodipicolinate synthase
MQFQGSFVAIITPFHPKGSVDWKSLEQLVEWHIGEGTDGIVCCGSTGEGVVLSDREKKRVAEVCVRTANKRIAVIVGTGTADTRQTVRLTESVRKLGADGSLVVTPYYNKPTQKGCILHFGEVAKVGLPVIVYHNPARAVVRLTAETIAEISQIPGIAAIKESSHDLELMRKVQSLCSIPILSGEDDLTFDILRAGGVGTISVIGNVIPRGWKAMVQLCRQKKWEAAERLAKFYMPLCKALFLETNPQCVKWAMKCLRLGNGILRLPLIEPSDKVQAALNQEFLRLSIPFFSRKAVAV